MVPQVAFRIQAHPSRAELADALRQRIPLAGITWDTVGPWSGYQKALSAIPSRVTHVCVLQDDVTLCRDFESRVLEAVGERRFNLVSLFVGGIRNRTKEHFEKALAAGERWSPVFSQNSIEIVHAVALVWPVLLAQEFLRWAKAQRMDNPNSDDAYVKAWAKATKQQVWATVPSLVQHPDVVPSTLRGRGKRRAQAGANKNRVAISFTDDT